MNLAVADLLYCTIPLPFYLSVYLGNERIFGGVWCKVISIISNIFGYADWMALSVVAFVRMLSVWAPEHLRRVCTQRGSKLIIAGQWAFVVMLMIPSMFEVTVHVYDTSFIQDAGFCY